MKYQMPIVTAGSRTAAMLVVLAVFVVAAGPTSAEAQRVQEPGVEVWPRDWFTDLPSLELTGTWVFDPAASDPMLETWAEHEVRYRINQHAAFITLEFEVEDLESNTQVYRWDGTIQRFERGGRRVEEAARWTDAGRTLEIVGRHWAPGSPENKAEYRFTYEVENDVLVFVQENDAGRTVWRFDLER